MKSETDDGDALHAPPLVRSVRGRPVPEREKAGPPPHGGGRGFGNRAGDGERIEVTRAASLDSGFTQVPNWLRDLKGLSHSARLTWLYLLQYSFQKGYSFPGIATLADDLEVSRHSVMRYTQELQDYGLLHIQRRGQGLTNVYHLRGREGVARRADGARPSPAPLPSYVVEKPEEAVFPPRSCRSATSCDVADLQHPEVAAAPHPEAPQPQHLFKAEEEKKKKTKEKKQQQHTAEKTISSSWIEEAITQVGAYMGWTRLAALTRADLSAVLRELLGPHSDAERTWFLSYLSSDDYARRNPTLLVRRTIPEDYEAWFNAGCGAQRKGPCAALPAVSSPPPPSQDAGARAPADESHAGRAWAAVCAAVRSEVTPDNYVRWLAPTRALSLADDVLTIGAPETFDARWLDQRWRVRIEGAARRVLPGVGVTFVVLEP